MEDSSEELSERIEESPKVGKKRASIPSTALRKNGYDDACKYKPSKAIIFPNNVQSWKDGRGKRTDSLKRCRSVSIPKPYAPLAPQPFPTQTGHLETRIRSTTKSDEEI